VIVLQLACVLQIGDAVLVSYGAVVHFAEQALNKLMAILAPFPVLSWWFFASTVSCLVMVVLCKPTSAQLCSMNCLGL
jgi:hypothetical protein